MKREEAEEFKKYVLLDKEDVHDLADAYLDLLSLTEDLVKGYLWAESNLWWDGIPYSEERKARMRSLARRLKDDDRFTIEGTDKVFVKEMADE